MLSAMTCGRHDAALLALAASGRGRLPWMRDALWCCELVHDALVRLSAEAGGAPSPCVSGCDRAGRPLRGHGHATLIPLDLDGDGRLDHVAVHAPMGLDAAAVMALERVRRVYGRGVPPLVVCLAGLGEELGLRVLGRGRVWASVTPFVPPRHLKPRGHGALHGQVVAELASRGLPAPEAVDVHAMAGDRDCHVAASDVWALLHRPEAWQRSEAAEEVGERPTLAPVWRQFRRERRHAARRPPMSAAFGLRLRFAEEVLGPVALGYASHYGLGLLEPVHHAER